MLLRLKNAGVVALMLLAAMPAFAQGPGGGPGRGGRGFGGGPGGGGFGGGFGGGGSPYRLLANPAVQEELSLTDEQKTKATALLESMREAQRGNGPGEGNRENFRNLSEEQRRERFAAMAKEFEERNAKVNAEFKPKFAEVLDEVQRERLQQISWQSQGIRALNDPELATALGLSQEQKEKIAAVLTENRGPGFGGGRGGNGGPGANPPSEQDREARRAEFQARAEKLNADAKAVLTDAQKTEFANLLGAEFDVSKLRGQGGPGGPGGDRGPGRRGPGGNRPGQGN
ncbi:Spy/CpxP family protein refolding chaperone [Planctomicrobium sp. SH661]|uniref:Spy/CpxP family protein refolding chaperone n=1 Tax=Planctomicrobium sp. SH661 TaxID=3448124 RepID=UPI003F5C0527